MHFYINRTGLAHKERWITLITFEGSYTHTRPDPQQLVFEATGEWLPRHGCVRDFINGIVSAGHTVSVSDRRWRITQGRRYFIDPGHKPRAWKEWSAVGGPAYWLAGHLWSTGEWDAFCTALQRVQYEHRFEALVDSAWNKYADPYGPTQVTLPIY